MNTWLLLALAGVADSALVDDSDVRRCSLAVQAINKRQQAQLDTLAPAGAHQLRGSFFFGGGTRLLVRERRREEHDDRGEEPEAERREEVAAEVALV